MKLFVAVLISFFLEITPIPIGSGPTETALTDATVDTIPTGQTDPTTDIIGTEPTDTQISAALAEQPSKHLQILCIYYILIIIVKMLYISVLPTRTVELRHFSGSTFSTGSLIDSISVSNPAIAVTSTRLAYRPTFNDFHGSGLAGIFVNVEAIFPCIADFVFGPVCRIFTNEENGFNQGRPFIESGDIGNNFQIFSTSSNIATYGFAIQGCTQMDPTCLQCFSQLIIKCLLPREQCS